jgi:4-amino-4-deoxy-L-arabinose transferase-like glycosyltransferase
LTIRALSAPSGRERIVLLTILALCWGGLTWNLDARSLWVDELASLRMVQGGPGDVVGAAAADVHPPLYFLAMSAWLRWAGTSDLALRWPSIAAGLVAVALMPGLARAVVGRRTAVPATLLLALAPAFVEFSRMARYYSLALALGTLSTWFFLKGIERNRWRDWLAYGLAALALLYTFYPSGALLPAQWAFLGRSKRRKGAGARWWLVALGVGAAFLPWLLPVTARQVGTMSAGTGVEFARNASGLALGIAAAFYTFCVGQNVFPWRAEAWFGVAALTTLLMLTLLRPTRGSALRLLGLTLACVAFLSFVTTYIAVGTPFLGVPVRGLFALPFFLLALAQSSPSTFREWGRSILLGVLGITWVLSNLNQFAGSQPLNPIYLTLAKEAAADLRRQVSSGDLVISDDDSVVGYYFLRSDPQAQHFDTSQLTEIQHALEADAPRRVWLATIGRDRTREGAASDQVRHLLDAAYRIESVERYLPIDPDYLAVKNRLLNRETYAYRLTIELYLPRP